MLGWALAFFLLAIVAAALGFGGIAGSLAAIAEALFFIFLVLFAVMLIAGLLGRRRIPPPV